MYVRANIVECRCNFKPVKKDLKWELLGRRLMGTTIVLSESSVKVPLSRYEILFEFYIFHASLVQLQAAHIV